MNEMQLIDMDKYRPFAKMGKTCQTREIREKKVIWPYAEKDHFGGKFKSRFICRADIDEVAELWRVSYPEIYGSSYEWIFFPEEYEDKVALKEAWEKDSVNKIYCMSVVEEVETKKLVAVALWTKDDKNLHVELTFGAIPPDYRKGKMGNKIVITGLEGYKILDESGAEYLTCFCETWHNISQYLCLKLNFQR